MFGIIHDEQSIEDGTSGRGGSVEGDVVEYAGGEGGEERARRGGGRERRSGRGGKPNHQEKILSARPTKKNENVEEAGGDEMSL